MLNRSILVFFLLVIFSGVMRFCYLGEWSFDLDELFTTLETKILYGEISVPDEYLRGGEVKAEATQLYRLPRMIFVSYYVHWFGYKIFGEDEFGSRVSQAILGALSVGVIFLMGRPIFGFAGALILSLLTMFLPEHLFHSQCNRFYMQSFLVIVVVFFLGSYVVYYRSCLVSVILGVVSVLMILANTFGGIVWGVLFCAVMFGLFCSSGGRVRRFWSENCGIIVLMVLDSFILLGIIIFHVMSLLVGWNGMTVWGYSSFHALMSLINMVGWSYFLFAGVGGCFCLCWVCSSLWRGVAGVAEVAGEGKDKDSKSRDRSREISVYGYWLFCVLGCGVVVFILPMKIVYNSNYGILFIFPFLVLSMLFICEVYNFILDSSIPFRRVMCVCWVFVCVLLNFPSVLSYYQDGNRRDNRGAFYYVSENWREGDRLTGVMMGAAEYYIPARVPRIPLHYESVRAAEQLREIKDENVGGSGRLWIVIPSSRGGIGVELQRWLWQNAILKHKISKKRFDYAENTVEVFLMDDNSNSTNSKK
ncbi:MAG: glycosyltransferase family 39 protein [Planctomycetaceae bacterium]|jgi:hypothetical protein|nr:glycosyltransferase family 39 protein [Planctomycetaceae bacterium]